jgi:polygalacturonase
MANDVVMMRKLMTCGLTLAAVVGAIAAQPASPTAAGSAVDKKLIEFGWDEPDTTFMRKHAAEMDATPFAGCVYHLRYLQPDGKDADFLWACWGNQAFTTQQVQHAINDLKATRFKRLRHNFLRFNVTPGNVDWFDDYSAVINNARLAARVAREGGVGILFDTEQYNAQLFDYRKQTNAATKTWDQYAAQARQRGREVMQAFQEGFPRLKVLMTFGYGAPWQESDAGKRPLRECTYGLLAPFLDGMVEAAQGGSQLIDGWESAYGYFEEKKFRKARKMMYEDIQAMVADRAKYQKVFSASFGLWMDYQWKEKGWNVEHPERNPQPPDKFEEIVRTALRYADEYVWIYSETPRWWSDSGGPTNLPPAYDSAIRRAAARPAQAGPPSALEPSPHSGAFNVREFGAHGDGGTLDTAALQKAIDACVVSGGGTVHFPPGRYLSGTLFLKSRVTVELEAGATLLGSRRLEDYPPTSPAIRSYTDNYTERSLIYGEQLEHVTLQGRGEIDGQGAAFQGPYKVRPYLFRLIGCREVLVRDLTLRDSPMWVQHYLACDDVRIEGVTVVSQCNHNNDGIDIDGCQRVRIANCDIQSGDDAIVLKSTLNHPCKHVVVANCVLSSRCNAFKLGTESNGGFENIVVNNCAIYDTRLAGIALETVDGGTLDRVNISNVAMDNVRCPIFIRLGNRARPFEKGAPPPGIGRLLNVSLSDIQASGADPTGCCIAGLPGHPVENVALSNIRISFAGGGKKTDAQRFIEEKPEVYPEYSMFGRLPAYGFYCRHARSVRFDRVEVGSLAPDARPSLVCEDVDGVRLSAWSALSPSAGPDVRFENVRDAFIHGCSGPRENGVFLKVGGKDTSAIRLVANAFNPAAKLVETAPEVPQEAVTVGDSSR